MGLRLNSNSMTLRPPDPVGSGRRKFAPAGQSTQLIIGASPESDHHILQLSKSLYQKFDLKRIFFSAYVPVVEDVRLPDSATPVPLRREHRLYQADWLMRFYSFDADELVDEAVGKIQDTEPEVARIAGSVSWFQLKEWLNATYSLGNVQKDIDKQLDIIRSAMGMIGRSKHAPQLLARFKETGSASDLMRYDTELAAQDKQAEALLQQDAASRQAAVPEPRKIEQEPVQESFDPYTIRIKKPENEKQKTVGVFLLEFTAPAYVVASIRDHLNRTGCEVEVKSFKVKR